MIAFLSGSVRHIGEKFIILETNGVGYQVGVLSSALHDAQIGSPMELFTYLVVRENLMELYGFRTAEEIEFFKKLLAITTIGPKTALGIMAIAPMSELKEHIAQGDPKALQGYPGIGKKTAERLIMELKHLFGMPKHSNSVKTTATVVHDLEALISLGYSRQVARAALTKVSKKLATTEERVHAALKILGAS